MILTQRCPYMKLIVRDERHTDLVAIADVVRAAFGHDDEAELVDQLRNTGALTVSTVLVCDERLIAHASASPMTWVDGSMRFVTWALAPVSVTPTEQRRGYGTKVVLATIERCRQLGADILTVLGNPAYYQRFSFEPASQHGMAIDGKEFGDAFMVMELTKGALHEAHGLLRWHPAFDDLDED